jgi:hypothetical protein
MDALEKAQTFAFVLGALAIGAIGLTVALRGKIIRDKASRRTALLVVWSLYTACAFSALWLFMAVLGAYADGLTDINDPHIRTPARVLLGAFVLFTLAASRDSKPAGTGTAAASRGLPAGPAASQVELVLCCAKGDEDLRRELEVHLRPLEERGFVKVWHAGRVAAGGDEKAETDLHLGRAALVAPLVTAELLASPALLAQLAREQLRGARVVPIIARPCLWAVSDLGQLSPLPAAGKPVSTWGDRNEAWLDVVQGILALVRR